MNQRDEVDNSVLCVARLGGVRTRDPPQRAFGGSWNCCCTRHVFIVSTDWTCREPWPESWHVAPGHMTDALARRIPHPCPRWLLRAGCVMTLEGWRDLSNTARWSVGIAGVPMQDSARTAVSIGRKVAPPWRKMQMRRAPQTPCRWLGFFRTSPAQDGILMNAWDVAFPAVPRWTQAAILSLMCQRSALLTR